jgi:hypothetical protein
MTLAFIAEVAGDDAAGRVQFGTEYYPVAATYGDYRNHAKAPRYVRTQWSCTGHNLPLGMPTHFVRKRTPFPKVVVGAAVLVSRNLIPFLAGLPARAARFIMPA